MTSKQWLWAGCSLWVLPNDLSAVTTLNLCSTVSSTYRFVWGPTGDFFVGDNNGAISRFTSVGTLVWTNPPPAGAQSLYALTVDRLNRAFASTLDSANRLTTRQITTGGLSGYSSKAPAGYSAFIDLVDGSGNLYVAGTSNDGLGGTIPAYGGNDVVVMKNPQLIYP